MNKYVIFPLFYLVGMTFTINELLAQHNKIIAVSGYIDDIQKAVDQASSGDTVLIPSGNFEAIGTVYVLGGVSIKGVREDNTILYRTENSATGTTSINNDPIFQIDGSNGESFQISDLTLIGITSPDSREGDFGIKIFNSKDFRVHHVTLKHFGWAAIFIQGDCRGVVDHNTFIDNYRSKIHNLGYGVAVVGSGTWPPLQLGTEQAVFIEDNYFKGTRHTVTSNNGARYVFRYNEIVDNVEDASAIDAHGLSSWPRGNRSYEIYENSINNSIKRYQGIGIRGGDGVIFNNKMITGITQPIALSNDGGSNCNYPCKDQIRELYIWNNTYEGQPAQIFNHAPEIIQKDRDYFLYSKPDYTPYIYPHPLVSGESLPLRIITTSLPSAIIGSPYTTVLSARGGQKPYQWAIISGTLPEGINLKDNTLSGTTNDQEGDYTFTLQVTDDDGSIATQKLSLSVFSGTFSPVPYFGHVDNWEPNKSYYWAVEEKDGDKRYVITTSQLSAINSKLATYSLIKNRIYGNFIMTLIVKSSENLQDNTGADFAIVFGYQDDNNYYYMLFNSNAPWSALNKVENGFRSEIISSNVALITDNDYHNIEVSRQGSLIVVKQDEVIVLTTNDATFGEGRVGIGSFNDAAYFDDIEVKIATSTDNQPPSPPKNVRVQP
ncbi:MAG: putative Ig domain-containing protein [bacterium]